VPTIVRVTYFYQHYYCRRVIGIYNRLACLKTSADPDSSVWQ